MPTPTSSPSPSLEQEVADYRAARIARLTAEDGWLTVVGKTWIGQGVHAVGAAPGSAIELPAGAPACAGWVTVSGASAIFQVSPTVTASFRGEPLSGPVELGSEGVRIGSITLQLIRRGDDMAVRVRDSEAPARAAFTEIPAYPVDPRFRVWANLRAHASEQKVVLEDGDGRPQEYVSPGLALFELGGVQVELEPVYDSDRQRLFVLFADATNRDETYGAGRFLYATLPEDGRLLLNFNLAFNPPCAFTPHATCPLPPANNRMPLRIEAGEKKPKAY
jgi:uncharacterized protein (DUF1684 family)